MIRNKGLKWVSIAACISILVIALCNFTGSVLASATNLVPSSMDAGFESETGFIKDGTNTLTTSVYRSGSSSLKLDFSKSSWGFLFQNISNSIFKDGSTYKVGLFVKTESEVAGKYGLIFTHNGANVIEQYATVSSSTEWTELSYTFTYASTMDKAFEFGIQPITKSNDVFYVDDFFITEVVETYEDESDDNLLKQYSCKGNMEAASVADLGLTAGGGVTIVSDEKHNGKYSLKFDTQASNAWGFLYMNLNATGGRGKTYKVSLWAKSADVTGPVAINILDVVNNKELFDKRVVLEQSNDWKYYESIFTVGETTENINIGVQPFGGSSGVVYVDDIMLTEVVTPDYEDDAPGNVLNKHNMKGNMEAASLGGLGFMNPSLNSLTTEEKHGGLQSLKVVFDDNNNVGWGFIGNINDTENMVGKSYRFSLWAKSADVAGDVGLIVNYNSNKKVNIPVVKVERSNDWVKYQADFKVTEDMLTLTLGLQPVGTAFSGTVYVDDVMLEEIADIGDGKDNGETPVDKGEDNPKTGEVFPLALASLTLISCAALVISKKR